MTKNYDVITYRSFKDFKFGSIHNEFNYETGETILYGRLKKDNTRSKYQKIFKLE